MDRIGQTLIRPLLPRLCAYDAARAFYLQFPDLNFENELVDYLRTGFVCSRPSIFAMAKIIPIESKNNELGWYIRMAVGDFREILTVLPCWLPWVSWCRNNEQRLRVYSTNRLYQWARHKFNKKET